MSTQWYYTENGQQQGPVSAQELRARADSGQLQPTDLVWREGMTDWVAAQKVKGLLAHAPIPPLSVETPPSASTSSPVEADASPYAPPAMNTPTYDRHSDGDMPLPVIKPASFWLYVGLNIAAFVGFVVVSVLMVGQLARGSSAGAGLFVLIGLLLLLMPVVLYFIYLYRAWCAIQPGGETRTTPGKAVGFCFIPFFNFYWWWVATCGWAQDYNTFTKEYRLRDAPQMPEGLFLANYIVWLVALLLQLARSVDIGVGVIAMVNLVYLVLNFMMVYHLCKGINYFARRL